MDGRTGEQADGRTGRRANRRTGEQADGRTGGRMDGRTYTQVARSTQVWSSSMSDNVPYRAAYHIITIDITASGPYVQIPHISNVRPHNYTSSRTKGS